MPKQENAEYGVFMFRGVDPRTTSFSIYLSGFSNAYKIGKDESGKPLVLRRTIQFPTGGTATSTISSRKRSGKREQPKWIYVPDEAPAAKK